MSLSRILCRSFGTSPILRKGVINQELNSLAALLKYLRTPTGCVHDIIPQIKSNSIVNDDTVQKMIRLSGLEIESTSENMQMWTDALNTQIGFIDHLRDLEDGPSECIEKASEVFRLLESDHSPQKFLKLSDLEEQIIAFNADAEAINNEDNFVAKNFIRSRVENIAPMTAKQ